MEDAVATVNPMLERAARAVATRRLAYDFGYPAEHEIVQTAVNARWRDYADEARDVIASLADPDDTVLNHVKPVKEHPEFVARWNGHIAAIVG